jgi:ribonucleoside-diphosphate reductase alpha chain
MCPASWPDTSAAIAAYLYLDQRAGENSIGSFAGRISDSIAALSNEPYGARFEATLRRRLSAGILSQRFAFSSPILMNLGATEGACLASCYILPVSDSLESITGLVSLQAQIFQSGGGCGVNLSPIRGAQEKLGTGISAPGPIPFMRALGLFSEAIRSGGRERAASVIFLLDVDHPDVVAFIEARSNYDLPMNNIFSVRLSNAFMQSKGGEVARWQLLSRRSGEPVSRVRAYDILGRLANEGLRHGEPGVQFTENIQKWNTCPESGAINGSNPCGEFLFLDNTAAFLASTNLLSYVTANAQLELGMLQQDIEDLCNSLDLLIDASSYPSDEVNRWTKDTRPVLVGYSNLGAMLLTLGIPYDSEEGRLLCSLLTSFITAIAYGASSKAARAAGPFPLFRENSKAMAGVLGMHYEAARRIDCSIERRYRADLAYDVLRERVLRTWRAALRGGQLYGYRNAQVTAIAPTGSISLLMGCESTGIEPILAPGERRYLRSGGVLRMKHHCIGRALAGMQSRSNGRLYGQKRMRAILQAIDEGRGVDDLLEMEHREVFRFALASPVEGTIGMRGHLDMVGAAAPHVSGGISKTISFAPGSKIDAAGVCDLYRQAWAMGVKGITIYDSGRFSDAPVQIDTQQQR